MRLWRLFRHSRLATGSLVGVVAAAVVLGLTPVRHLEIVREPPRRLLLLLPVKPGMSFSISFRHSVEGIRVRGEFLIESGNTLRATSTSYPSYGAGLEKLRYGPSTRIGKTTLTWFPSDLRFPELVFRITTAEDFRLQVPGRVIVLSELVPDSTRLRIRVRRRSLLWLLSRQTLAWPAELVTR